MFTKSFLIFIYLAAIVVADLVVARLGPSASVATAAVLISLTLTTRDRLHDEWGDNTLRNMAILIAAGSGIAYLSALTLSSASLPSSVVAQIALASFVAFAANETVDTLSYEILKRNGRPWFERVTTSNLISSAVDSALFVWIAFGWDSQIILAQWGVKVAGGVVWGMVLARRKAARAAAVPA